MVQQSLQDLRLSKLDLLLAHSAPVNSQHIVPFWRALEYVKNVKCLTTNIGVSNFSVQSLELLRQHGCDVPVVNQIEYHPFFKGMMGDPMLEDCPSQDIIAYCEKHGIIVMAYSPLQPLAVCNINTWHPSWFGEKYLTSKKARSYLALDQFFWFDRHRHKAAARNSRNHHRYQKQRRWGHHLGATSRQEVIDHIVHDYDSTMQIMAQVNVEMLLRWHLDAGRGVVTTSSKPTRAATLIAKVWASLADFSGRDLMFLDTAPMWSTAFTHYCEFREYFDDETGSNIY